VAYVNQIARALMRRCRYTYRTVTPCSHLNWAISARIARRSYLARLHAAVHWAVAGGQAPGRGDV